MSMLWNVSWSLPIHFTMSYLIGQFSGGLYLTCYQFIFITLTLMHCTMASQAIAFNFASPINNCYLIIWFTVLISHIIWCLSVSFTSAIRKNMWRHIRIFKLDSIFTSLPSSCLWRWSQRWGCLRTVRIPLGCWCNGIIISILQWSSNGSSTLTLWSRSRCWWPSKGNARIRYA